MIPKIIHYCWFGQGKMPILAQKCIESWRKYLPEYELKLWNEESFDLYSNTYTRQAYEFKKYAFVTDYVRLYALHKYGGIYMDTDVEVLKNLDQFLELPAFSGFESDSQIPTGIMASEKNGKWVEFLLLYYKDKSFITNEGTPDPTTNVTIICEMMNDGNFKFNNTYQNYKNIVHMFPKEYFCPKSYKTGKILLTRNSHTIHHFAGSWLPFYGTIERKLWLLFGLSDRQYIYRTLRKLGLNGK